MIAAARRKRTRTIPKPGDPLTERELDVLNIMIDGATLKHGGAELGVSEQTIKNHVRSIHVKLGTRNLVGSYRKLGWLRKPTGKEVHDADR